MAYVPDPIDTKEVELPDELVQLTEVLAKNTHELWARKKMAEGWCYGQQLDNGKCTHPNLVPYHELPEADKDSDRVTAMEALRLAILLGYTICRGDGLSGGTGPRGHTVPGENRHQEKETR